MKKVKKTGLLLLVFAILLGVIAGVMGLMVMKSAYKETSVLVAKKVVEEGDPLTKELFEVKKIHISGKPETALPVDDLDLSGTVSAKGMLVGDILRQEHIIKLSDSTQELPLISTRIKAIGNDNLVGAEIPVSSIGGILDGIKKGDTITVVSVIENTETKEIVSRMILVNIEVVAVKTGEEKTTSSTNGVVAVALTQEQFKKLSLARDLGSLHVAVQPLGVIYDESIVEDIITKTSVAAQGEVGEL